MLYNDPKSFKEDMLHGYEAAYPDYVTNIPGGVARSTEMPQGKVAVVNGGGSGHYPAFCGIVGDGFMDATVVGNVFTSPSTEDVLNVTHAVNAGTGVFLIGGNYAGDKMNFNLARDALKAEGIDCRTFYITDDLSSASEEEVEKRRGNVGTFFVFKSVGAAAAAGASLDELERVAKKANDMTRTMSIGFRGCTLPGQDSPLFEVPVGRMEVGQGIHGEPGVGESELASANEIAKLLVNRVISEAPVNAGKRVAVILDGLGSTKYEELFVLWGSVRPLLEGLGCTLVEPLVGEYVTSLDMEGVALSVQYLDDELEGYWLAPCDTPSFRRGETRGAARNRKAYQDVTKEATTGFAQGTAASRLAAEAIVEALRRVSNKMAEAENELAAIDGIAGDGDHGRGMVKGSGAAFLGASEAFENGASAGSVLKQAGKSWAAQAGGTSGVLWGSALEAAGEVVGDTREDYDLVVAAQAARAACEKMVKLGGAQRGDKTMLDSLIPFVESLNESQKQGMVTLPQAWEIATDIAQKAAEETANLIPKVGRARPAAERSLGTPDAGAISMAMCMRAALPSGISPSTEPRMPR